MEGSFPLILLKCLLFFFFSCLEGYRTISDIWSANLFNVHLRLCLTADQIHKSEERERERERENGLLRLEKAKTFSHLILMVGMDCLLNHS